MILIDTEHATFLTTARHNGGLGSNTAVFPEQQTTGCQFSQWRAVGVAAQNRPFFRG